MEYLIVVIVTVHVVPMEGYSEVHSDGIHMDRFQLPRPEACPLIVRQGNITVDKMQTHTNAL